MIQATPQTIGDELLQEVQLYADNPDQITDFALRKLENRAKDLARVDAATAHTVRAAIAAFKWDSKEVDYWTKNALHLEKSFRVLTNAAVNKTFICDFSGAADLALESLKLAPGNSQVAFSVCNALMSAGRFDEVIEISRRFEKKSKDFESIEESAASALKCLIFLEISLNEFKRQLNIANSVAREHKVQIRALETTCIEDFEGDKSFVASLHFFGDINKEIELDEALVEKFEYDENWDPLRLSIQFRYLTKDELQAL